MITHKRLLELLAYDPKTGIFTWRVSRGKVRAGQQAGSALGERYCQIMIDYQGYSAHRLAVLYTTGEWPVDVIDHISYGDNADAEANIRSATWQQNRWNTPPKIGHSKWKGVTYDKGRSKCWKMSFKLPTGPVIQKRFADEREAAEEYMFLALEHHGEFVRLE